jgi:hypothetical protein
MHRSVLQAEVEYHLKMQERARDSHQVWQVEAAHRGFLSRILGRLKRDRQPQPQSKPVTRPLAGLDVEP